MAISFLQNRAIIVAKTHGDWNCFHPSHKWIFKYLAIWLFSIILFFFTSYFFFSFIYYFRFFILDPIVLIIGICFHCLFLLWSLTLTILEAVFTFKHAWQAHCFRRSLGIFQWASCVFQWTFRFWFWQISLLQLNFLSFEPASDLFFI